MVTACHHMVTTTTPQGVQLSQQNQSLNLSGNQSENRPPLTDGWHGLEVVSVMEAMSRSIARNGEIQAIERIERTAA